MFKFVFEKRYLKLIGNWSDQLLTSKDFDKSGKRLIYVLNKTKHKNAINNKKKEVTMRFFNEGDRCHTGKINKDETKIVSILVNNAKI